MITTIDDVWFEPTKEALAAFSEISQRLEHGEKTERNLDEIKRDMSSVGMGAADIEGCVEVSGNALVEMYVNLETGEAVLRSILLRGLTEWDDLEIEADLSEADEARVREIAFAALS